MPRQPRLFANSPTAASDIPRTMRSSAGCVITYSEPRDSAFSIFAVRAGSPLCICSRPNDQSADGTYGNASQPDWPSQPGPKPATAAGVSLSDLIAVPGQHALCGSEKDRVHLAFPYSFMSL